ncbi:hypothetical protein KR009_003669 [Drosophila setifemur]|nr:hypothetical protein KR009_003669 [Drosophila setifemur]
MHGTENAMGGVVVGAWDNPGISIFATAEQEPVPNMLSHLIPMPIGSCDHNRDACQMRTQSSIAENSLFRQVKFQVEEVAADRQSRRQPKEQMARTDGDITMALAQEKRRQEVEASRRVQLHRNAAAVRDLEAEVACAHTALSVKRTIQSVVRQKAEDKQRERSEALAEQRAIEQERRDQELGRIRKAAAFRNDLMAQITETRTKKQRDQREADEEGRRELRECEAKVEQERIHDAEKLAQQRRELMESLHQSAEMMRITREAAAAALKGRPERGILDALGPVTAAHVSRAQKLKREQIEARDLNAARLGFQLSQIKRELEAREQLITNLLIREVQAKENEQAMLKARTELALKRQIRDQLLGQREEQKFFRDKAAQQALLMPKDPTCFGERQYQMQLARRETGIKLDEQLQMVADDKRRKREAAEEVAGLVRAVYEVQEKQDALIAAERMKVLAKEPREVLTALRTAVLTDNEIKAFNLRK